ncbi:GtrA family protein [Bacillus piscicola]|uniref:GtrA family protein n=1 Tax=Bacillus piscicola TaxID=1632684 RepID=UPI001F090FCA|nr:GtrA family protein [Bacillus piscicola]
MKKTANSKGPFQFLQFSIIGIANAGVDIGTLNLLLLLFPTDDRVVLVVFNTIAYSLAVANSYFWNASITFRHTVEKSGRQRLLFILQGIVSLGVSNLVFLGLADILQLFPIPRWFRYNLAKGIAMFLSFTASFFMIKYFVFKKKKHQTYNR